MGLVLRLQTVHGDLIESVEDLRNALHRLLPPADDLEYPYLSGVDWEADTVFNAFQASRVLVEWHRRESVAIAVGEIDVYRAIERLIRKCVDEGDLYLKFVGD